MSKEQVKATLPAPTWRKRVVLTQDENGRWGVTVRAAKGVYVTMGDLGRMLIALRLGVRGYLRGFTQEANREARAKVKETANVGH